MVAPFRCVKSYLGNPWKLLSDDVSVRARRSAKFVEINLLVKIYIFFCSFVSLRISSVIKAGGIIIPFDAAESGWVINSLDDIRQFPASGGFVDMSRTVFAAIFRKRNGDETTVERRNIEIYRRRPLRIQRIRVENNLLGCEIIRRFQHHKERLVLLRLQFHRKKHSALIKVGINSWPTLV